MVNAGDLLQLEYTPDLTEAGIAYACQHIASFFDNDLARMNADFRQLAVNKAVELAFRRYLRQQGIAHKTVVATRAGDLDPYHLIVRGWHCILCVTWINSPKVIKQVMAQPECLLQAGAVLPAEQIIAWVPGEKDVYIFGYVINHEAGDQQGCNAVPTYWIILLPRVWSRPKSRGMLGRLELTYRGSESLHIVIGGKGDTFAPVSEHLVLHAGERVISQHTYAALEFLHTSQHPTGPLSIYSTIQHCRTPLQPSAWTCLNLSGQAIYLGGFITHAEFARRSYRLETGSQVFPGIHAQDKARLLWVRELHPLRELFADHT